MDDKKFCFITCVNDEFLYKESVRYIENLQMPPGMKAELLAVRGAKSMTAGYQAAMEASEAKYKIYLHQDVFVVNSRALKDVLKVFSRQPDIGIIGLLGASNLEHSNPVWWESSTRCGKAYFKREPETIHLDNFGDFNKEFQQVTALDGIFLATQYDVPWRSDLFNGWHFYDISQTREFIKHGYQAVVVRQEEPWLVHACGRKVVDEAYLQNMEIFKKNYY